MSAQPYQKPTPMAQPGQQPQPPHGDDLNEWITRVNDLIKDPSHVTNPQGTSEWYTSFFDCFNPIDTCLITYFCPCVTFGKTHHKLRRGDISTWSPLNASCLTWAVASMFGCGCIPTLLQKSEIRHKASPPRNGDFVTDFLKAWCCHCCELIQQDKEAEHLLSTQQGVVMEEPAKTQGMNYPA